MDSRGLIGSASAPNGITVAPGVNPIGTIWSIPNGPGLSIRNKVVTAALSGTFWLEEINRSAAVKVVSSAAVVRGNTVSIAGVLGMSGSQRALIGDVVINPGGVSGFAAPVGMLLRSLGGAAVNASTPGVSQALSAYNVGLRVRCWGNVTYYNAGSPSDRFFYIDDGTGLSDGSGHAGVKVRCGSIMPPTTGMVTVTAIVTTERAGASVVPVLVATEASEILPQ